MGNAVESTHNIFHHLSGLAGTFTGVVHLNLMNLVGLTTLIPIDGLIQIYLTKAKSNRKNWQPIWFRI